MIAKNIKGKSFGGCVRYVLNDGHEMLAAEGVLADDAQSIIRSFAVQRSGRPEIKQPVGHIPISFSPEDSPRMTNEFMLQLAGEYMEAMNIRNTQYIVVRHHNTANDHLHIVYNRIDNDLKLISVNNDYRRNVAICKKLKKKHNLTFGTGKENVRCEKLADPDKVKYEIYDTIKDMLPYCTGYPDLEDLLGDFDITMQYKYRSGSEESPGNIQGVSFRKDGIAFKGSQIDRKFSHANLQKSFEENRKTQELTRQKFESDLANFDISKFLPDTPKPQVQPQMEKSKAVPESKITPQISDFDLSKYLPDASKSQVRPAQSQAAEHPKPVETFLAKEPLSTAQKPIVPPQRAEIQPHVTQQSASKPPAAEPPKPVETQPQNPQNPEPKQPEPPKPTLRNTQIRGIELTAGQDKTLRDGGYIYLENMNKNDSDGKFSAYVFADDEKKKVFFSNDNPDKMVEYGEITIRLRDKILIERGHITKAKMKWWGGIDYQHPFVWKDSKDNEVKYSFSDPRIPKEVHQKELGEFRRQIRQSIPKKSGPKIK